MKKIAVLFFSIVLLIGCKESNNKNEKILSESSGRLNSLSIVIDNELWEGQVGENLREKLAAPVDGLPQQEPLFSLNQIPPKAFSGFAARNRTFLYIKNSQSANFEVVKDTMAKPQTGIYISGATLSEINFLKPNKSCYVASQQFGCFSNKKNNSSSLFIHRECSWKP